MPVDRAAAVAAARLDPATPKHWLLIVVLEALSGCTVNWLSGCQSGSRLPARSSIDDDITTCSPSRPFYSGSGREVEDSDFACGVDICRWRRTALVSSALAFALAGMTVARLSLDIILALRGQLATIFRHDPRLSTIWTWSRYGSANSFRVEFLARLGRPVRHQLFIFGCHRQFVVICIHPFMSRRTCITAHMFVRDVF